jgi:hypothetical protein
MPRIKPRDTEARHQLKIMDAVSRRMDELHDVSPDAVAHVLTWIDGLVEGNSANEELKAMKAIAAQFEAASPNTREVVVRWLFENYGSGTRQEDDDPAQ